MNNKNLELAIYISAALLAIGVFLPLTKLPIYGDVTYNKVASIESWLVILCALSAPVLVFLKKAKLALFSPIAVWVVLLFPAIKGMFKSEDSSFLGKMADKATSAMQEFAGDLFLNVAEFSWGGYVFLLGLLVFTVSCVVRAIK